MTLYFLRPPVLFTQYWMRVIPPRKGLPDNTVMFECSFQMNKTEIKDYLKDIYNLDTLQINTEVFIILILGFTN
jgi:hypothetical protein